MKNKLNCPVYLINITSILPYLIFSIIVFTIIVSWVGTMRVNVEQGMWNKMFSYGKMMFKNSSNPYSFSEIVKTIRLRSKISKQIKLFYKI